jgi:membrane protein required for colicin V production
MAFLARGLWTGFIRQLTFIAALLLGFLAAGRFHGQSVHLLESIIANRQLNFLITYVLLFVIVYLLVMLLGKGLKKVMSITFLGWFDRLLGGLFGILKAVFITSLIFMVVNAFLSGTNNGLKNSLSYPFFM